ALHGLAPKDWLTALVSNPYHTFRRDYYWVLTDDTSVAPDSRHLGILPADAIEGVILFAL
ncbi:MAG: signal peptidase I, partial [Porphyromonadaceae bacterium]|nr:signal peptidase I [Porphyromonadaceae bacterium]